MCRFNGNRLGTYFDGTCRTGITRCNYKCEKGNVLDLSKADGTRRMCNYKIPSGTPKHQSVRKCAQQIQFRIKMALCRCAIAGGAHLRFRMFRRRLDFEWGDDGTPSLFDFDTCSWQGCLGDSRNFAWGKVGRWGRNYLGKLMRYCRNGCSIHCVTTLVRTSSAFKLGAFLMHPRLIIINRKKYSVN